MSKYLPQEFESKWVEKWEKEGVYKTPQPSKKDKMYLLDMFPYPSGDGLHVGHVRIYTASDVLARFYRMSGKKVLHPMGWDAFGLPAENAAIKAKKSPQEIVPKNIATFKKQMRTLGFSYDWDREFATTDPSYYRWTQWLFIQFFKMGLLYKKSTPVYYCEFCKTGLAEEEVLPNGTHERCGNPITRKELPQWIFKITTYADRLLEDMDRLDWPQGIIEMQRNWIGRKEGAEVEFKIPSINTNVRIFTTRVDTIFGATFLVVSPEIAIKWVEKGWKPTEKVSDYIEESLKKTDQQRLQEVEDKTGAETGLRAVNPVNNEEIPVWVADYVLAEVGTGAIMGVPAHDEKDFEFAKKMKLKIREVIKPEGKFEGRVFAGLGISINSGEYSGLKSLEFQEKLVKNLEKRGLGKKTVTYHLRDWIFSRQRYWGEPIPMVYCENCAKKGLNYWKTEEGKKYYLKYQKVSKIDENLNKALVGWFPLKDDELPLELPEVDNYDPTGTTESPLIRASKWVKTKCPNCGGNARRETDTMPNWAGSCWYFLRFADPRNAQEAFSKASSEKWLPVDYYIGGAEHAVLHLLYARFWIKAMYDLGLVPFEEPFLKLKSVGLVLAQDSRKMSKSFGNVLNPDEVVQEFGADPLRIYEMFMAPFSQEIAWSTQTLQGSYRFIKRIWQTFHNSDKITKNALEGDRQVAVKLQKTIVKVGSDIPDVKFNTAVAAMMKFLNEWEKDGVKLSQNNAKNFLKILSPFAPYVTEEIWRNVFKEKESIHLSEWPKVEKEEIKEEIYNIPVQVNGKLRAVLVVPAGQTDEKNVLGKALANEKVKTYIEGKKYKIIYREPKILNFIVK